MFFFYFVQNRGNIRYKYIINLKKIMWNYVKENCDLYIIYKQFFTSVNNVVKLISKKKLFFFIVFELFLSNVM